jgi:hypothetical protein
MSLARKEYVKTPEGIAHYEMLGRSNQMDDSLKQEDYLLNIPTDDELDQEERINW